MQRDRTTGSQRLAPATGKQRGYLKHLRAELGLTDPLPARLNRAQASDLIAACKSIIAARDTGENVDSYHGMIREGGWTVTRLPDGEKPAKRRKKPVRQQPRKTRTRTYGEDFETEWSAAVERHLRDQARRDHEWMDNLM